mmetsp:Transcript_34330/g.52612  ORF Transcript_34330/g.52612 Transcript_34330/m.52612 type:complete len:116 (-) Transcript_34330:2542-2889(-)
MGYEEILKENPDYIDSYLRIANLALTRGDPKRALYHVEQSMQSKLKMPINQILVKGRTLASMGKDREADEAFLYIFNKLRVTNENYVFLARAYLNWKKGMQLEGGEQTCMLLKSF